MLSSAVRSVRRRLASSSITNKLSDSAGVCMAIVRLQDAMRFVQFAIRRGWPRITDLLQVASRKALPQSSKARHATCLVRLRNSTAEGDSMNLTIWLPAMLLLALAALGLMVLFVEACDKV